MTTLDTILLALTVNFYVGKRRKTFLFSVVTSFTQYSSDSSWSVDKPAVSNFIYIKIDNFSGDQKSFSCWVVCLFVKLLVSLFLVFKGVMLFFLNLIDATDRSKISSDKKRFFIALSLYSLSFFANTPFKGTVFNFCIKIFKLIN